MKLTFADVATTIAQQSGRPITFVLGDRSAIPLL
jgi:hypothetical protein